MTSSLFAYMGVTLERDPEEFSIKDGSIFFLL